MNAEKKTALVDLIECSGFTVLVEVMEELVRLEEARLLKYDLRTGDSNGLLIAKCEADGARKLSNALQTYLRTTRVAASKA